MVTAAKCTIVEVEEIVEAGVLQPDEIHTPGIFVDYFFKGEVFEKRFEKLVYDPEFAPPKKSGGKFKDTLLREKIVKRAVNEIKHGMYVNLGIGIPTLLPAYLPKGVVIEIQSEIGILGLGNYPRPGLEDPDLINAGKETITVLRGSSIFSSSQSFGIMRGGHLDMTFLGAMQV